jgi:hypothetical protein
MQAFVKKEGSKYKERKTEVKKVEKIKDKKKGR